MRYLFLIFVFIISVSLYAQTDNKGQSIELPDFVITGVQSLDVPIVEKKKAQFISTLSEEFLTPSYSPDEFSVAAPSGYIGKRIDLFEKKDAFEGGLKVGAGRYTMPAGEFHFSQNWDNYLLAANVWTSNIKDYIDNAGYNISGGSLRNDFYVNTKSGFMPGLKISFGGNYYRDNYKFFGSQLNPTLERKTQNGLAYLSFLNVFDNTANYGLEFSGRYFKLSDNDFNEMLLNAKSFIELKFQYFGIKLEGEYKQQLLENNLTGIEDYNYFTGRLSVNIKPVNGIHVTIGAYYSQQDTETFFMPTAAFSFRLDKNLSMYGEFSPSTEFLTITDFVDANRYYNFTNIDNMLLKNKTNIRIAVKYEFEKYFEINAGIKYSKYDNFVYYEDAAATGKFDLKTVNNAKNFEAFANTVFHLGPMGQFYGDVTVQQVTDSNGDFIPYQPVVLSSLVYSYNFDFGFGIQLKYNLALNIHTDMTAFGKLNDYHNLACKLGYKLSDNFEVMVNFNNIFNKDNFILKNYEDIPFDIIGGIYYHW